MSACARGVILVGGRGTRLGTNHSHGAENRFCRSAGDPFSGVADARAHPVRGRRFPVADRSSLRTDRGQRCSDSRHAAETGFRDVLAGNPRRPAPVVRCTTRGNCWTNVSCYATATRCSISISPTSWLRQHRTIPHRSDAWCCARFPNASRFGVVELDGDRVTSFPRAAAVGERAGIINAGIYLLDRRILPTSAPRLLAGTRHPAGTCR